MDIPKPEFLIEGLLLDRAANMLFAAPKAGKTLLGVQMAVAVASGQPLLGYYAVREAGPVLIVERDDPDGASSIREILMRSPIPTADLPIHFTDRVPYEWGGELMDWIAAQVRQHHLRMVLLDSFTVLRGSRGRGVDIVKAEAEDIALCARMAKSERAAVEIVHHSSKGSSGLSWADQGAGTFAMAAGMGSLIHISRYPELDMKAPERLVRARGRHCADNGIVLRFREDSLDFEFVMSNVAAELYPEFVKIGRLFGTSVFTPKQLTHETGWSKMTAHRHLDRLLAADLIRRPNHGEYTLAGCIG
ncbi:MAG: AAA family ATPase [Bryobacterales bacterium]|nr:AAA family ATPase [Bryobacterales bacterium]